MADKSVVVTKLFVGNLPSPCSIEELRKLFEKYGAVKDCSIIRDYAFVHMLDETEAEAAVLELNDTKFKGSVIRVLFSNSKTEPVSGEKGCTVCGRYNHSASNCFFREQGDGPGRGRGHPYGSHRGHRGPPLGGPRGPPGFFPDGPRPPWAGDEFRGPPPPWHGDFFPPDGGPLHRPPHGLPSLPHGPPGHPPGLPRPPLFEDEFRGPPHPPRGEFYGPPHPPHDEFFRPPGDEFFGPAPLPRPPPRDEFFPPPPPREVGYYDEDYYRRPPYDGAPDRQPESYYGEERGSHRSHPEEYEAWRGRGGRDYSPPEKGAPRSKVIKMDELGRPTPEYYAERMRRAMEFVAGRNRGDRD